MFTGDLSLGFDRALDTMEREQDHPRNSQLHAPGAALRRQGQPGRLHGHDLDGFRPSDDACTYNYLIPSEMMAVVALGELEEIERDVYHNLIKANRAKTLRDEVQTGIQTYGVVFTPNYGYIYAYEVDGLGNSMLMDDANIPSLLSAPVPRLQQDDVVPLPEHAPFLLSRDNPTTTSASWRAGSARRTRPTATSGRSR